MAHTRFASLCTLLFLSGCYLDAEEPPERADLSPYSRRPPMDAATTLLPDASVQPPDLLAVH